MCQPSARVARAGTHTGIHQTLLQGSHWWRRVQLGHADLSSSRQRTLSAARGVTVTCDDCVAHGSRRTLDGKGHLLFLGEMGSAVVGGLLVRGPELVSRLSAAGGLGALNTGSTGRTTACSAVWTLGLLLERQMESVKDECGGLNGGPDSHSVRRCLIYASGFCPTRSSGCSWRCVS